jgi:hypothetical protein
MVRIEKNYVFDGPNGKQNLKELFDSRRQLIVYHFMFDPEWDKGCPGCTGYVSADRDTTFALVSRAPLAKLEAYKSQRDGASPGSPHLAAISIMTSTSRLTRRSRPLIITIGTRRSWRQAADLVICKARGTA